MSFQETPISNANVAESDEGDEEISLIFIRRQTRGDMFEPRRRLIK